MGDKKRVRAVTRYLGCNDCTHVTHTARSESYLCVKRGMWIWPWLVNTEDGLPECLDYQGSTPLPSTEVKQT